MIGIYLCDDEDAVRHQIQTALEWKIFVENYDMRVVCSAAGARELLTAAENEKRGIYFLDVELKDGEWDGFRLGQELRRRDPHGTLVYITSYGDLAWRTFQYHLEAFDYIVKEPERIGSSVSQCLGEIHTRLLAERRDPAEMFTLRSGEAVRHIPLRDILFFETSPNVHKIILHCRNRQMEFLGKIKEIERQVDGRFYRCHRSFLVNKDNIKEIDFQNRVIHMVNGDECLISSRMMRGLK